jgi:hypothetical protein
MKRRNLIAMHINFRRLIKINEFAAQMFGHGHQWPFNIYAEAIFHHSQFPEGKYRNWIANAAKSTNY